VAERLRIGLLGGSFNPAHSGHLYASRLALSQLDLDYVWWLVSPQNPLKPAEGMASLSARLTAAQTFAGPRIVVTDLEAKLGTQFTIDTLNALKRRFPQLLFVWLMGSDTLADFPRWRRWQDIFLAVPVAIVARPGTALAARMSKPAHRFRAAFTTPSRSFAAERLPAWTVLDAKRNSSSATALRLGSLSP
jgi:nicotinate-nucleotide adenylyltransferase